MWILIAVWATMTPAGFATEGVQPLAVYGDKELCINAMRGVSENRSLAAMKKTYMRPICVTGPGYEEFFAPRRPTKEA